MKIFAFIVLTMAIFGFVWGDETCTFGGTTIKAGETHQPSGECSIFKCEGAGSISAKTCPAFGIPLHCKNVKGDVSKPYPSCCDNVDCEPVN